MGPECPLGDVGSGSGEDGPVHLTVHVSTGSSRSWSPYLSKSSPSLGSKVNRDPSWVIWVIQSMWPTGFAYGAGFISDQMPPGFSLLVHEPLGSAGAYLRVHAERGIHRAGRYFHNLVFVGVGVGRVLLSNGAPPLSVLPGASGDREARGVPRRWALVHRSLFPLRPRSRGRYSWVRLTRGRRTRPEAHTGWG